MELRNLSAKNFGAKCVSKVWDIVRSNFDTSDDEMVEEITERIVDVADADPYFAKMFGDDTNNVS
jgi:hypothetical protein|tara:strand:+ start:357 stop:551 length:195 start_codon:yes stop_codon:yes gene_type:complete